MFAYQKLITWNLIFLDQFFLLKVKIYVYAVIPIELIYVELGFRVFFDKMFRVKGKDSRVGFKILKNKKLNI